MYIIAVVGLWTVACLAFTGVIKTDWDGAGGGLSGPTAPSPPLPPYTAGRFMRTTLTGDPARLVRAPSRQAEPGARLLLPWHGTGGFSAVPVLAGAGVRRVEAPGEPRREHAQDAAVRRADILRPPHLRRCGPPGWCPPIV